MTFLRVLTGVASVIALFTLFGALVEDTAPKQAAAAAIAVGIAVIPYVFMRAVEASRNDQLAELRQIARSAYGNGGILGRICQLQEQKQGEPAAASSRVAGIRVEAL
jgi:hypothetical protein